MKKWESEKHKSWGLPAEGFKGQVATVFWALQESGEHVVGQWCNWIFMENWGPMYGCMENYEPEFQRTIKRAELTAFLCLLK